MSTVEEYVRLAEEAQQDNSHVAVLTYYRTAIEETGYGTRAADILLAAVKYAQRLKNERDRKAISQWGLEIVNSRKRVPLTNLATIITEEIAKLQHQGDKNARA